MAYGTVDKTYISSQSFIDDFEFMSDVLDVTAEERSILDILEITGQVEEVTGEPEFHHWENDYMFKAGAISAIDATENGSATYTAGTVPTASTGQRLTITVATDDEMPVAGELVLFDENEKVGYVYSVDTANKKYTCYAVDPAVAINVAGTEITTAGYGVYFSSGSGEGTGSPVGRQPKWNVSKNNIQIFKESGKVTDLQKVSELRVKYNGSPYVMYKLQNEVLWRHRAKIGYAFIMGQKGKTIDGDGNDVWLTQGLNQYILNGDGEGGAISGGTEKILSGAIAKADIKSLSRQMDKKGAPNEYWAWFGGDLRADWDDLWVGQMDQGSILYNSFGVGNAKQKAIDLGVDSLSAYGRTFHVKTMTSFDHPEVFGAGAFGLSTDGFLIPTGKIKVDKSGKMKPRIQMRYMKGDGTDFRHMETLTGKLAPTPTNDDAYLQVSYETIAGFEACGVKHFAKITGA